VEGDAGRGEQQAKGDEDGREGEGQGGGQAEAVVAEGDQPPAAAGEEQPEPAPAKEDEGAVATQELDDAAEDEQAVGEQRPLGRVVVEGGDGHLDQPQAMGAGEELHLALDGKAAGGKGDGGDGGGGKGAKAVLRVGDPGAGEAVGEPGDEPVAPGAGRGDGLAAGGAEVAGADDDVGLAGEDGGEHLGDLARPVLPVGVEGDDGAGGDPAGVVKGGVEGGAFAAVARVADDVGTGGLGDLGGGVARAVVDDDDEVGITAGLEDDAADEALFVEGGDDGDRGTARGLGWRGVDGVH
jgi:hypothetical protein